MNLVELLGFLAGTLTTLAFLPQVVKTWRSKSAKDLSMGTLSMICSGVLLWLIYGILAEDLPITVANAVTLVFVLTAFALALIYRSNEPSTE